MANRTYTEADYHLVMRLADTGQGARAIARETGIPRSTVQTWMSGDSKPSGNPAPTHRASSSPARAIRPSSQSASNFVGTSTPFKRAQDVVSQGKGNRAEQITSNPAALTVRQPDRPQLSIDYDVARITGEQRAIELRRREAQAMMRPSAANETKTLWEKALDASDNPFAFLCLGIAAGLQKLWRTLFGEPQSMPANNQLLLTAGNQSPFAYQPGVFAQPDYQMDAINGLNGMDAINGLSSSMSQLQWNDPASHGLTAQQAYGYNLTPEQSDYYTCYNCGQLHMYGYGCPWSRYQ